MNFAGVPLNVTLVVPVSPFPKIRMTIPTLPKLGTDSMNDFSPTDKRNRVPQPPKQFELPPPELVPP